MPEVNAERWRTFIEELEEKEIPLSVLQTAEWAEVKNRFGWSARYIITDAAAAVVLFRSLPRWTFGATIAYIPRGPILLEKNVYPLKLFWEEVHRLCQREKAVFLRVEPEIEDLTEDGVALRSSMSEFRPAFATVQPPRTILLSTNIPEQDWLTRMNQKTRYNTNFSLRPEQGLKLTMPDDVETFYSLFAETGARNEFGVHSLEYYQDAYDAFHAKGKAFNLVALADGEPIAALMLFIQGERGYYLYGASSNEGRNRMPNHFLQYHAMRICAENGCKDYDLWGIPDAEPIELEAHFKERSDGLWGVYRFKRGFGGRITRFLGSFDKVYHPLLYRLFLLADRYRRSSLA